TRPRNRSGSSCAAGRRSGGLLAGYGRAHHGPFGEKILILGGEPVRGVSAGFGVPHGGEVVRVGAVGGPDGGRRVPEHVLLVLAGGPAPALGQHPGRVAVAALAAPH